MQNTRVRITTEGMAMLPNILRLLSDDGVLYQTDTGEKEVVLVSATPDGRHIMVPIPRKYAVPVASRACQV